MIPLEPQFRIAEIEVNRSTIDDKILGLFRYASDNRSKSTPTTILILAEIASTLYVYEQLLDTLNETAEQVRHLITGVDTGPMARFEKLTQRLNDAVSRFVQREPTPIAWNRVNLFILQLSEGHLCFSGIGSLANLFLQKQKDSSYRQFNLFGSLDQPTEIQPEKPFASLICGDIKPGDILFAGSLNFQRLFGELHIPERLQTLTPVTAALEIRQDLETLDLPDDFTGVVIANIQPNPFISTELKPEPMAQQKSTASVEYLRQTEATADALLSPVLAPMATSAQHMEELEVIEKPESPEQQEDADTYVPFFSRFFARKTDARTDSENTEFPKIRHFPDVQYNPKPFWSTKRRSLAIGLGILFLFVTGTVWYRSHKAASARIALWNTLYDQATDRKNRAEAELVMGNEDRTKQWLDEADGLVNGLDEKRPEQRKNKNELQTTLRNLRGKLRRAIIIDQPEILYTLPQDMTIIDALTFKDRLLFTNGKTLSSFDLKTKQTTPIFFLDDQGRARFLLATKEEAFLLTEQQTLFHIEDKETKAWGLHRNKATSTQAATVYGKRLYLLDPSMDMVWRFSRSGDSFGQETSYIKQNSHSLSNARALAIDSNVYVGFADGTITRYLSGAEETWMAKSIDPPIKRIDRLWVNTTIDRLIALDGASKRILVFRCDGTFIAQISSPAFQSPLALSGDETRKKIYLADTNRLFSIDMP